MASCLCCTQKQKQLLTAKDKHAAWLRDISLVSRERPGPKRRGKNEEAFQCGRGFRNDCCRTHLKKTGASRGSLTWAAYWRPSLRRVPLTLSNKVERTLWVMPILTVSGQHRTDKSGLQLMLRYIQAFTGMMPGTTRYAIMPESTQMNGSHT